MTDLISYAQNFEDVMLWRALRHVHRGHYVDVGAQSPDVDSVSRLFYERGWRGTHVEPVPAFAARLRMARPDEDVVQAALAAEPGALEFFELPDTGLSTLQASIAAGHAGQGFTTRPMTVPALTLDHILSRYRERDVHWLKVDVEGAEEDVLRGWRSVDVLPWIVLVESTLPLTQAETHHAWEPLLIAKGYRFVYFDGLNRFYVAPGQAALADAFRAGPNLFDGFALSGTASAPFCRPLTARIDALHAEAAKLSEQLDQVQAVAAAHEHALDEASASHARLSAERDSLQRSADDLASRLAAEQARLAQVDAEHIARLRQMQGELSVTAFRLEELQVQHAGLVDQLEQARIELACRVNELEHHRSDAHRWWRRSESLAADLALIHGSRSWRLTAPLRATRRQLQDARIDLLTLLRPAAVRAMRLATRHPLLARTGGRLLRPLPGTRARLLAIARREGLLAAADDAETASTTAVTAISVLRTGPACPGAGTRPLSRREQVLLVELRARLIKVA